MRHDKVEAEPSSASEGGKPHSEADHTGHGVAQVFAAVQADGFLHAVDIDSGEWVGHQPDVSVPIASVFKLPVLLELYSRASAGSLDLRRRVRVPDHGRTPGPTGLSIMQDPVDMSLRDLAYWMISVSDNAATDVLCDFLGVDTVNARLENLGLPEIRLVGNCRKLLDDLFSEFGPDVADMPLDPDRLRGSRSLDPSVTTRGTARAITALLSMIWRDEVASPEACREMRRLLGHQVWPHRLRSGFPYDDVTVSGKTGTLPGIRNEAGVVEYPDGGRYAVAVFTRSALGHWNDPPTDAAIGTAAQIAVSHLRAERHR
jgi:beta-lactamase class A